MDWNDLRFFLAVAQAGSLSAAASTLGVSTSTVSRRIDTLERDLGIRLFLPHRDGYDLTDTGRELIPAAERAAAQMRLFERSASGADGRTAVVRVEAPELLAQGFLMPTLGPLLRMHPTLRIDLRGSVRTTHLGNEEADLILRLVRPEKGNYIIRRVGRVGFGLYAAPGHAAAAGIPAAPDDLRHHRVLGWSEDLDYLLMARWLAALCPGLEPQLRLTSLSAQLAAVRHGLGWAVLPHFAGRAEGFTPAPLETPTLEPDLWLLTHQEAAKRVEVRLCRDRILETLRSSLP